MSLLEPDYDTDHGRRRAWTAPQDVHDSRRTGVVRTGARRRSTLSNWSFMSFPNFTMVFSLFVLFGISCSPSGPRPCPGISGQRILNAAVAVILNGGGKRDR